MRQLKVEMMELEAAFEDTFWEHSYYFDLETGNVVMIGDETRRELEDLYAGLDDGGEEAPDLDDLLQGSDLPDWRKESLRQADEVEAGYGKRYVSVPRAEAHQDYRDMEDFIATVENERLRDRLWRAIEGRGAFRYFRDVLYDHPREREHWFEFKDERAHRRILDWLAEHEIEPIYESPPSLPPEPPARPRLIAEALQFVQAASRLPGVMRIALIGSLTTDEPEPKDVDMLVPVTDEADLEPLAVLGRKLQGHTQAFNRGGEVFLADSGGNYLGRTCPWRQCGPGIRMSCDAQNCGRRLYLHDDLKTVRLAKSLVVSPPIELWPQVLARVPIPADVEEGLIAPLKE